MAWPIPGVGIDDPEALYCPIFSAHAYLLGKKEHLMIVPRFENDPIKLAEPAFRKIYLETTPLLLPDGSPMPVAHELWIRLVSNMPTQVIWPSLGWKPFRSQDKRLQVTVLVAIWEASDLDFQTLMDLPPSSLCFILVLHWLRRKERFRRSVRSFLIDHRVGWTVPTLDRLIWKIGKFLVSLPPMFVWDISQACFHSDWLVISQSDNSFENIWKLINFGEWMTCQFQNRWQRARWYSEMFSQSSLVDFSGWFRSVAPLFKTMDLLPDMMFDGMVFQKKYEKGRINLFVILTMLEKTNSIYQPGRVW